VRPGHATTIPVVIHPDQAVGTVVSGTIYLLEWSHLEVPSVLTAVPYEYVVGS